MATIPSLRSLLVALLAAPFSAAQLLAYPPLGDCRKCTVPHNLNLPECETPHLSECYCQGFTAAGGEIGGVYISPILSCARSSCTGSAAGELLDYYSGLCAPPPASIRQGTLEISDLLTAPTEPASAPGKLSASCSACLTAFTANTLSQCTPGDLSACLCSSDPLDRFAADCPCAAPAKRAAALLGNDSDAAPPTVQLLKCLHGARCSGADKALLARWGEGRCGGALAFMGDLNAEEEAGARRLKVQGLRRRDRMGSMSSWGADEGFEGAADAADAGRTVQGGGMWVWVVGIAALRLGGGF